MRHQMAYLNVTTGEKSFHQKSPFCYLGTTYYE